MVYAPQEANRRFRLERMCIRNVQVSQDPGHPGVLRFGHRLTYLTGVLLKAVSSPQDLGAAPLHDRELYLLARSDASRPLLSLHPFWILRPAEASLREEAFVLNGSSATRTEYISYQSGEHFTPSA